MLNRNHRRNHIHPFAFALIFCAVASTGAQAGGAFRSQNDAYEACRSKIEQEWSLPGLHRFDTYYGRNRSQSADQAYVFWINSRVHNLDTGEVQQLRSRCSSAGFGLVTELTTETGRWELNGN